MRAFRWGGTLLFGSALAWFAYQYLVTFAAPAPGVPDSAAVARNVTLFTLFALHHSIFARTPVRRWITAAAPGSERSIYVWIASLLFIGVCTLWEPVGGVAWQVSGSARWLLAALQLFGVVVTLRGAAVLDVRELAGLHNPAVAAVAATFTTAWPYGWVRHPIYLGWFLFVWPVAAMTNTRLVFALVSCVYLVIAIPFEEGTLRRTSGGAYDAYRDRIKWRLLPGIY